MHRPRKRFGQHFLTDSRVVDDILTAIQPRKDEHVVEIGPGRGALTQSLARYAGRLTLIELDRDLVSHLRRLYAQVEQVEIISADALEVDYTELGSNLRVVGNLPYNISTPLLFHLAAHASVVRDMHFMLQKEVVDRIVAEPGSKAYGRLGVMLRARLTATHLFDVAPDAFDPPPRVQSAVVRLNPALQPLQLDDPERFASVVTQAFSQRRKTLRNTLKGTFSADELVAQQIDPQARAETLSAAQFARLANSLTRRDGN
ncbi:MAG: 16S rRNA (adenine(1518)-N(6)/adenine(1519)-N(6))-dimethyltransferase RsmA [Pseudomonadota bacterium]